MNSIFLIIFIFLNRTNNVALVMNKTSHSTDINYLINLIKLNVTVSGNDSKKELNFHFDITKGDIFIKENYLALNKNENVKKMEINYFGEKKSLSYYDEKIKFFIEDKEVPIDVKVIKESDLKENILGLSPSSPVYKEVLSKLGDKQEFFNFNYEKNKLDDDSKININYNENANLEIWRTEIVNNYFYFPINTSNNIFSINNVKFSFEHIKMKKSKVINDKKICFDNNLKSWAIISNKDDYDNLTKFITQSNNNFEEGKTETIQEKYNKEFLEKQLLIRIIFNGEKNNEDTVGNISLPSNYLVQKVNDNYDYNFKFKKFEEDSGFKGCDIIFGNYFFSKHPFNVKIDSTNNKLEMKFGLKHVLSNINHMTTILLVIVGIIVFLILVIYASKLLEKKSKKEEEETEETKQNELIEK